MTIVSEEKSNSISDISYFTADTSPYGTTTVAGQQSGGNGFYQLRDQEIPF